MMEKLEIQIAQEKAGRTNFTNSEYNKLLDLSVLNTIEYGYAVFEACGILGIHPVVEYHSEAKTRSSQIEDKENTAYVYPNPANNNISVDINCNSNALLRIFDINGRLMLEQKMPSGTYIKQINLNDLAEGCYLIFIFDGNKDCIMRDKLLIVK